MHFFTKITFYKNYSAKSYEDLWKRKKQHQRTHVPVEGYKIEELKLLDLENLVKIANECEIENPREFRRQELIFEILKAQTKKAVLYFLQGF